VAIFVLVASAIFRVLILYTSHRASYGLSQASTPLWHTRDKLVFVVIDGVPAKVVGDADHYPTIVKLIRDGNPLGRHRTPAGFTTTAPIVVAMGTGGPADAKQFLDNFSSPAVPGDSLFRVLRRHGFTTAVFGEKIWADLFGENINIAVVHADSGMDDLYTHDRQTYQSALDHGGDADFMVVHFVGSDHAGHRLDFADPEYRKVSRSIDGNIAGLIARFPDRHFIVTADHGMSHDRSHVRPEPMVIEPPFLCVGPRFHDLKAPDLSTVQIAPFITAFFGAGPPASATEVPPRNMLALGAAEETAYKEAFFKEVILHRRNVSASAAEPSTWGELLALNRSTLEESRRVPLRTHAQALALLLIGLIGVALYRAHPTRAWISVPIVLVSWLLPEPFGFLLFIAAAVVLVIVEMETLRRAQDHVAATVAAGIMIVLVCAPLALIDDKLNRSSLPRFAPAFVIVGALLLALFAALFRRALLAPVVALGLVWSMFFLAHRWPQGAAVFAVTGLSAVGLGWLIFKGRRAGEIASDKSARRSQIAGAALVGLAWVPFYLQGGAPSALDGLGTGLHVVPESMLLRGAAAALFAGWILWLYARRRDSEAQVYAVLTLAAPPLAFIRSGFASEVAALCIFVLMIVIARTREARLAAASAALFLVSSSAQAVAAVTMAWGFVLLGPSLRRATGPAADWLAAVLLTSCFYILGMTFHAGRIETILTNPDLVATSSLWLVFTVALVFLKVSLALVLLVANWTPAESLEGPLLRFAWLSALPLMLLHQRGYPAVALAITPIILLFIASALLSRLLLSIPSPGLPGRLLRPAAPPRAVVPGR
jgi:hypothetical protein